MLELADTSLTGSDATERFGVLTTRCVQLFDFDSAGVMLAGPKGDLSVTVSSSAEMRSLEVLELEVGEGPCVDCYRTGAPVLRRDLASARNRWPSFARHAAEAGFRTVHAVPMRRRSQVIGALNLFSRCQCTMDSEDAQIVQAFADLATVSFLQRREHLENQKLTDQLEGALRSRVFIEQAKGVLSERRHIDVEVAFDLLRTHARSHNRRLIQVAQDVIAGGDF